ncbi:curli biogenesis system outer membrane secretion channel CsgG [Janthinobacterium sp. CG_23.3]|uniref:CzcE family metal-binding protein n=1 Tax=Janthinobacterium sp. CG_23.3 TaxID=3349634 RepID=UPI0038D510F2
MKPRLLLSSVVALLLSSAGAGAAQAAVRTDLLGEPAPLSAATRTVRVGQDTRWVNVTGGEVVRFVSGDREFAWNFNGIDVAGAIDLNQIAPRGALTHSVKAYVAPNPLYAD